MAAEIDLERLFHVLDMGRDAQAKARAMGDEAEEGREALRKARLGAEAGKVMHHRREDRDPATVARIAEPSQCVAVEGAVNALGVGTIMYECTFANAAAAGNATLNFTSVGRIEGARGARPASSCAHLLAAGGCKVHCVCQVQLRAHDACGSGRWG